jgi:hypothetical protein
MAPVRLTRPPLIIIFGRKLCLKVYGIDVGLWPILNGIDPKQTFCASFDHLVGAAEQREWNSKAERLSDL